MRNEINYMKKHANQRFLDDKWKYFLLQNNRWVISKKNYSKKETANAKELFYTLENVQVDCRDLSEGKIINLKETVVKNGYTLWDYKTAFELNDSTCYFVKNNSDTDFLLSTESKDRITITYDKFMELFGEEKEEVKTTEQSKHHLTDAFNYAIEVSKNIQAYKEDKPAHYSKGIDTFSRMEANCTTEECLAFAKGNIDKYNFRTKGQDLEDFKKIISYANWAISLLNKGSN